MIGSLFYPASLRTYERTLDRAFGFQSITGSFIDCLKGERI